MEKEIEKEIEEFFQDPLVKEAIRLGGRITSVETKGEEEGKMRRISEVIKANGIEVDEFTKIDTILGQDLIIDELHERQGQYGVFYTVKAKLNGKVIGFNTGSSSLMKAFSKLREKGELPVMARIEKIRSANGNYYYKVV